MGGGLLLEKGKRAGIIILSKLILWQTSMVYGKTVLCVIKSFVHHK